ncbi:MAG: hypothetical protein ACOH2E_03675 [Candidatus Paracaedibacter sp.]
MDSKSDFSSLELRNGSKLPATVTIYYNIQGLNEGVPSSFEPAIVNLAPISTDGVQDKKLIVNPKRYGLVSIEVDGGVKFHNVVDLISAITVASNGSIFHSFNYDSSPTANVAPEWLFKSLTFKKFDLRGYAYNLSRKWDGLTEEQRKSPFTYDIPSCLHAISIEPEITTPFSLCFKSEMKHFAIEKYTSIHPEIKVTEEEIQKAEADLISKGIPLIKH